MLDRHTIVHNASHPGRSRKVGPSHYCTIEYINEAISAFCFCSPLSHRRFLLCVKRLGSREGEKPIMGSSLLPSFIQMSSTYPSLYEKPSNPQKKFQIGISRRDTDFSWSFSSLPSCKAINKSVPLAASIAILLWSSPGTDSLLVVLI